MKEYKKELLGFTAGNFDLLHPGYIKCFKWAKKHCDKLIIFILLMVGIEVKVMFQKLEYVKN